MTIIIILIWIILILAILCCTYVQIQKNKLEEIRLYESIDFDSKYELLGKIITEEVDDYKIKNFVYRENDLYINEDMQKEMINIVTTKVLKRITPAIKTNIKLIYNINNNEDLINTIGTIVSMQVLSYCIETNVVREE